MARQVQSLFNTSTVGYTRGLVGDKAGPGPQRERITALCAWQPPPLHLIIDEAPEMVSTPLADRPGGTDLLILLCARISTVVVVDTLDRLFPTLAECMAYVEAWGLQGVMLRVLDFEGEVLTLSADNNALFLAALAECRHRKTKLIIAKLDRLARSVHFIAGLMESGVGFVAADMPNANDFMLHIYAAVAQEERRLIS